MREANVPEGNAGEVQTLSDVLQRLDSIDRSLTRRDGVWWFNHLYLAMTQAVVDTLARGGFEDPSFIQSLDVRFARLYLAALSLANEASCPKAWRPLLINRYDTSVPRIVFALLGVNAHINRDLMVALVTSFPGEGGEPQRESARYRDYQAVDQILTSVQSRMKGDYESGLLGGIDNLLGSVDDLFEVWSLSKARQAAWDHAEILWTLRDKPIEMNRYVDATDRLVGYAGRALLLFG